MACRLDMRMTPSASVTVTTMGRPSGMAATALRRWKGSRRPGEVSRAKQMKEAESAGWGFWA